MIRFGEGKKRGLSWKIFEGKEAYSTT